MQLENGILGIAMIPLSRIIEDSTHFLGKSESDCELNDFMTKLNSNFSHYGGGVDYHTHATQGKTIIFLYVDFYSKFQVLLEATSIIFSTESRTFLRVGSPLPLMPGATERTRS